MRKVDNLHEVQVNILRQFKAYCVKYNLKYNLEGGTLLGAVRHKGFIPWDDDIDIIMPRQDYDRFLEFTEKEKIASNLSIITSNSGKEFRSPYIKICHDDTIVYEGDKKMDTGIFIDVFPMDGAANWEWLIRIRYIFMDMIKVLENYAWMNEQEVANLSFGKKMRAYFCKKIGTEFWGKWLHNIFTRYECGATKYVSQVAWSTLLVFNKSEEYLTQTELEFEGELYTVPSCYDNRLRKMYGDYMKLPPEEEQKSKHEVVAYWKD